MPVVATKPGGWLAYHEDRARLRSHALTPRFSGITNIPNEVDPGDWMHIESQQFNDCRGNSGSTCVENLRTRSGLPFQQMSRFGMYIMTQRIDGIRGDSGSTIEGGIRLLMTDGLCSEADWPYPGSYSQAVPAAWATSIKTKIDGHMPVKTYEQVLEHLGLTGPIDFGIMWTDDLDRQAGANGIIERYSPAGRSGHALAWLGYRRTDWTGAPLRGDLPYIIMDNSWSKQWGFKGRALLSPASVQAMLDADWTVAEGIVGAKTDAAVVQPVYM